MGGGRQIGRALPALLCCVTLCACAAAGPRAKGALVPLSQDEPQQGARRFALLIGVGAFDDPAWQPLRWTTKDAADLGGALEGFASIRVLTRREDTTRAGVLAALDQLRREATSPGDTVLLYLSTHGTLARKAGGWLTRTIVTSDTRRDLAAQTGLTVEELYRALDALPSHRKAVIFAFCHSGKGKSALGDDLAEALSHLKGAFFVKPLEEVSQATMVLSASAFGETAAEDDGLQNDVYTHFLVAAIAQGRDANGDGAVTLTEAHEHARDQTYAFTAGTQRPALELHLQGVDPIVLKGSRLRQGKPVVFSYAPSAAGLALFVNGARKGDLPGSVVVEAGVVDLALVNPAGAETVFEGSVDLAAGEAIDIARLIPPPITLDGGAGIGILGFFDPAYSSTVAPPGATLSASLTTHDLWRKGLQATLALDYLHTSGTVFVGGAPVPFQTDLVRAQIGPGASLRWGDLRLAGNLLGGLIYLGRSLHYAPTRYDRREDLVDFTLSISFDAAYRLWGPLWLSLSVSPGLLFTQVDGAARTEPLAATALLLRITN